MLHVSEEKYFSEAFEDAILGASSAGFEVERGDESSGMTLLLDLDGEDAQTRFLYGLKILAAGSTELFREYVTCWKSKSGNWHVLIELTSEMKLLEQIALQAILGSDNKREALHWRSSPADYRCLFRPTGSKIHRKRIKTLIDEGFPS